MTVTLPRMQEGNAFNHLEKKSEMGFLTLSKSGALEWNSLRRTLNKPVASESLSMVHPDFTVTRSPDDKRVLQFASKSQSKGWFGTGSSAEFSLQAETEAIVTQWLQDIAEAIELFTPRLQSEKSSKERLVRLKERMDERQQDRQNQLKAMGNVGMKYTSEIMMTRQ